MPSGLTEEIYNNESLSLKRYILKCAKQFNPFYNITMGGSRELSDSQEPEYSTYDLDMYREKLQDAKDKLSLLTTMTPEETDAAYQEYAEDAKAYLNERLTQNSELRQRYLTMLKKSKAWECGSFVYIKEYMIKKLVESMEHDCWDDGELAEVHAVMSKEKWLDDQYQKLRRDIGYYQEKIEKEEEQIRDSKEQIRELYHYIKNID